MIPYYITLISIKNQDLITNKIFYKFEFNLKIPYNAIQTIKEYVLNKKIITYILCSLCYLSVSYIHTQTSSTPTPIIGDPIIEFGAGYIPPTDPPINPDAQLYLPRTLEPTEVLPPARDRETLLSQTNAVIRPPSIFSAGFTFAAQYGQFDKLPYTDIYLSPYMKIGPLFVAYEVPLRFDWNKAFITRMWRSNAALISKIEIDLYYSKTNHIFKNIQASIYKGEQLYQGHGRFFYDYNPNLYAPYEPFKTFKLNLDISYFGINYIIANIAQPDLMSAEIFIKPLQGLKNPKFTVFKDLKIYALYGMDLDPFQSYSPALYEFAPNNNSPIFSMFEAGIDIPLFSTKNNLFKMMIYGDYAQIIGAETEEFTIKEGYGISGGIIMTFVDKVPIKFEISKAFNHWQPRWVNMFYYLDRPYINQDGILRENKFMTITPDLTYFTTSIGFEIPEKAIFLQLEFYGDFSNQDLWITASFTLGNVILKQLSLSVQFTLRSLYTFTSFIDPNFSIIDINLKYHMLPNMYWGLLIKMNGRIGSTFVDNIHTINTTPFIFLGIDYSFRY